MRHTSRKLDKFIISCVLCRLSYIIFRLFQKFIGILESDYFIQKRLANPYAEVFRALWPQPFFFRALIYADILPVDINKARKLRSDNLCQCPGYLFGLFDAISNQRIYVCSHFGVGHCLWPLCNCQGTVCIVFEYGAILKDKKILIDILDLKELTDCRWCVKNIKLILILLNIIEEGRLFNATFVCASVVKWI